MMIRKQATSRIVLRTSITLPQAEEEWAEPLSLIRQQQLKYDWRTDTGYGLMDIYVDVAGLPEGYRPNINTLHGIFLGMAEHWYKSSEAGLRSVPATFVHNEQDQEHLESVLDEWKRILVAPHPFHYVVHHYASQSHNITREGAVFFLPHGIGQLQPRVPLKSIIQRLTELSDKYGQIDICVHSNDLSESLINTFRGEGFNIVTAGDRHSPLFLHRFYWLCRRRRFAITMDHGTQLWLSSMAGCEIVLLKGLPDLILVPANNSLDWIATPREHYWPLLDILESPSLDQQALRKQIDNLTGKHYWLDSKELRDLFEQSDNWYRSWSGREGRFKLPCRYWSIVEPHLLHFRALRAAATNRLLGRRGRWQPLLLEETHRRLIAYERAANEKL